MKVPLPHFGIKQIDAANFEIFCPINVTPPISKDLDETRKDTRKDGNKTIFRNYFLSLIKLHENLCIKKIAIKKGIV